jgi:S-adenosylmethionine:tRNA ribosyltransferase-isomerase
MVQPGRRLRPGDRVLVATGNESTRVALSIGPATDHGLREVAIDSEHLSVRELLKRAGHVPLPPYIRRADEERDYNDYQTIYAEREGAVAAPTAGLHFTTGVFEALEERGVGVARVTLHVGVGTFQPVRTPDFRLHRLKAERFAIPEETADHLNRAKADGRRVIAVGTTTTRTLEHVFARHERFVPGSGDTDLFIYPDYRFRAIDGLLTNFHLPRSTLLMLVSAFAGPDVVRETYHHAVASGYRFYSFGDATLFV